MRTFVLILTVAAAPAAAQQHDSHAAMHGADTAQKSVLAVVHSLFDGMRTGDSAKVRAAFHPRASLATTSGRGGIPAITFDSLEQFIRAVGTPHADAWNETIRGEMIHVDQGMAMVWAPYDFHAGTRFSHCGVNNFQLARTTSGWKIIALVDTRQRAGCPGQPTP